MSFKQRLKSSYTMTRFDFSWKMIPESRSRDRKSYTHIVSLQRINKHILCIVRCVDPMRKFP